VLDTATVAKILELRPPTGLTQAIVDKVVTVANTAKTGMNPGEQAALSVVLGKIQDHVEKFDTTEAINIDALNALKHELKPKLFEEKIVATGRGSTFTAANIKVLDTATVAKILELRPPTGLTQAIVDKVVTVANTAKTGMNPGEQAALSVVLGKIQDHVEKFDTTEAINIDALNALKHGLKPKI